MHFFWQVGQLKKKKKKKSAMGLGESFTFLAKSPYIRDLATLVRVVAQHQSTGTFFVWDTLARCMLHLAEALRKACAKAKNILFCSHLAHDIRQDALKFAEATGSDEHRCVTRWTTKPFVDGGWKIYIRRILEETTPFFPLSSGSGKEKQGAQASYLSAADQGLHGERVLTELCR